MKQRMIVPAVAVIDLRGLAANLSARIGDILLIALPACFGSMRRKDKAQGLSRFRVVSFVLASRGKTGWVAHADVNRQCYDRFVQDIFVALSPGEK